jgi:TRAP-type C4-dicarboxylate transport system substrate-binding protein
LGGIVQTIAFAELPMPSSKAWWTARNPIATIYAGKMWETQKYLSILNYTYVATHLVMNKASFNKLSANQKQILIEEAVKAGQFMQKTIREGEGRKSKR